MDDFLDKSRNMQAERDAAYHERNMLVAALARLYPAHLMDHPPDPNWDPEWLNIVCIDAPCGQMTWHIHVNELPLFEGLPKWPNHWDGHTTDEKYARLAKLGA
jgi:hypothetical protein